MAFLLTVTLSFTISLAVGVILHELGHVCAAWLVRLQVREVRIGMGKTFFQKKLRHGDFVLKSFPICGMVSTYLPLKSERRLATIFFCSGGIIMNTLLLIISFIVLMEFRDTDIFNLAISCSIAVQSALIIRNSFPRKTIVYGKVIPNDGLAISHLIFNRHDETQLYRKIYFENIKYINNEEENFQVNAASERAAYHLYWVQNGNFDQIAPHVHALQSELKNSISKIEKVLILETLVTVFLSQPRVTKLDKLNSWSETALSLRPDLDAVKATRASVLIESDKIEEGLKLLSTAEAPDALNRTFMLAYEALAYHKANDRDKAKAFFRTALTDYDRLFKDSRPYYPLLLRIGAQLEVEMPPA